MLDNKKRVDAVSASEPLAGGKSGAVDDPVQRSFLERAVRNFGFSGIGTVSSLVLTFLFSGLTIRYLGADRAGFFMSIGAYTGLNALIGDLGIGTPAVRRIAVLNAEQDFATARRLVGSVAALNAASSLLIVVPLVLFFPTLFSLTRLPGQYRGDALLSTILMLGSFVVTQASGSYRAVYGAMERYDLDSAIGAIAGLTTGAGGIAVLSLSPTMSAIAGYKLAVNLARVLVDGWLMRRLLKGFPWPAWEWAEVRPMFSFGKWVYAGNLGRALSQKASGLILTGFLGSAGLPYYEVPRRAFHGLHGVITSQARFLFPMLASCGDEAATRIRMIEDRVRWAVALASAGAYTFVALVGPDVLGALISPEFAAQARVCLYLVCLAGFAHAQAIVPYYASWAIGSGRPNSLYLDVVLGLAFAVTALFLVPRMGFTGAAVAQMWIVPIVVVHTLEVRGITTPDAKRWSWVQTLVSPSLMAVVWILTAIQLRRVPWAQSIALDHLGTVVGALAGVVTVWLVERIAFPDKDRFATVWRTIRVTLRLLKPRRVPQETEVGSCTS